MPRFLGVLLLVGLSVGLAVPASANLVTNGGFETGDFTGWDTTLLGNTTPISPSYVGNDSFLPPHTGNFTAYLGPVGSDGFLSQTLATTPGKAYTLTFWLASTGDSPNDFSATVDGITFFSQTNISAQSYTEYTFDFVATGPATPLQFGILNDFGYQVLDDVSVVPEPSSMLMIVLGGLVMFPFLRRRHTH